MKILFLLILAVLLANPLIINAQRATADCEIAQTSTELDINNVRARIQSIGDMWWDLQGKAVYEIPKGSGKSALFAGSIWIGGKDANNQTRVATTMFRQRGVDFAPGPLITSGTDIGQTSVDICRQYDKMWSITKDDVKEFRAWWNCQNNPNCNSDEYSEYIIPDIITNWPAHGPQGGYDMYLAPFWDNNNDGYYNPYDGDFPYFEFPNDSITDDIDCLKPRNKRQTLKGDQAIWFVFNDAGKEHTNSGSEPIGMEIRAIAYAYATNTPLNDLTFYNYEIINRSTETLYETYVGFWTDVDLGYAKDDYIGCDVQRGLGYTYNGDNNDETAEGITGYGSSPPAIGIDIFEGLFQDPDGQDNTSSYEIIDGVKTLNCSLGDIMNGNINGLNFQDEIIDNERWGATNFLHYNGAGTGANLATLGPTNTQEFYNYLTSHWTDGSHLLYDGTGHYSGGGNVDVPTNFMFPGNPTTDICGYGQNGVVMPGWSEEEQSNPPGDRRFIISNGPVTFYPGAVNNISMGVVYGRAINGDNYQSVEVMKRVDDMAQNLFDNCFRVLDGPDAPDLTIIESDKKLIFHLVNKPGSNNYLAQYSEKDYNLKCDQNIVPCDEYYNFQGYQVFQLKNPDVDILKEKHNSELVKQVFQCDVKDTLGTITNFIYDFENAQYIPQIEVYGEDKGISHTFVIEKDMFGSTNDTLVNQKDYWYTAIAYAANKTMPYDANNPDNWYGNKNTYLVGKNNIKTYTATPHIPSIENNGTVYNTEYGFSPQIIMTEGHGNANCIIELSDESIDEIMSGYPWRIEQRTYKNGKAPISIKIIDPLNIPDDEYVLKFIDVPTNSSGICGTVSSELSNWFYEPFNYCIYNSSGDTIYSDNSVMYDKDFEQIFPDWGFSVNITTQDFAGAKNRNKYQNGFLEAEILFENTNKPWLDFVKDQDSFDEYNWIRVGTYDNKEGELDPCGPDASYDDLSGWDDNEYFENILGGSWAPYRYTSSFKYGLALNDARNFQNILRYEPISSVDLVITSDKSKWTRACVVEMHENEWQSNPECGFLEQISPTVNYLSIGNAHKFALRKSPSVDKEGNTDSSGTHGMGWFPGYAIDQRTGERLNIIFGEDSFLSGENGSDMLWNPTSTIETTHEPIWGGKHMIYIMGNNQNFANESYNAPLYDSCRWIYENLITYETTGVASTSLNRAWTSAMWCAIPILNPNFEFMDCDVTVKLRVSTPYHKGINEFEVSNPENNNFPTFKFSTNGLQPETSNYEALSEVLDIINIVPNPYYWGNHYGNYTYDNYVRIINLPKICEISIYTASGNLVRKVTKNDSNSFWSWDLNDKNGNKIANGMYIIHIDIPGVGEKTLKWFGSTAQE
jgi:hypothetical protein